MLQGGAEAQKRNMIKLTGAPQNLSQALLYFFATLINGREKLVHLCFAFLSLLPILAGVLSFNSSGSVTHVAGETRRVWRFHRIKNLRAIKKSGDTGHPSARAHCHKPGRGGGGMVKHRLYIFISVFSSKRGGYGKIMFYHCGIAGFS